VKLATLAAELGVNPPYVGANQWAVYAHSHAEMAGNMLTYRNPHNRPLIRNTAEQYGRAMLAKRFPPTGQTVSFDSDGNLLDGQNRLWGVCYAKVTVPMLTVFNVNREDCFSFIDGGKRRSLADALYVANHATRNRVLLAGTILALYEFCTKGTIYGMSRGKLMVTNQELLDFADWYHGDLEEVAARMASELRCPALNAQSSAATALHAVFARAHPNLAEEFFKGMAESAMSLGEDRWDGGRKLVKRVAQKDTLGRIERAPYCAFLIKAWNCYVRKDGMERLSWYVDKGEAFPQVEGVKYAKDGSLIDPRYVWPPAG